MKSNVEEILKNLLTNNSIVETVSAHGQLTLSSAFLKLISAKPREEVVVTYNQEEDIIIIKKAYDTSVCCVCGETIVPKDAVTLKGSTLCHKCIDKLYKKKSKA